MCHESKFKTDASMYRLYTGSIQDVMRLNFWCEFGLCGGTCVCVRGGELSSTNSGRIELALGL